MKKNYQLIKVNHLIMKSINRICLSMLILFSFNLQKVYSQNTYSFTNASATGSLGPNQAQINSAYLATNLNGSVICPSGIQSFTFVNGGSYQIVAAGAAGGGANSFGGRGRIIQGNYIFSPGDIIRVVVGQKGILGNFPSVGSSGGGGGSYVILYNGGINTPIIIGGGGAGFLGTVASPIPNTDANILQPGFTSVDGLGAGGAPGNGGLGSSQWGGGGGGYNTNGTAGAACLNTGGQAFVNGSSGAGTCNNSPGGFGGGGGTHGNTGGGGGGGGYSGGGGSGQSWGDPNGGGGGGSYFSPSLTNTVNAGLNLNLGYVTITQLCAPAAAPADATPVANLTVCPNGTTTLAATGTGTLSWYATNTSTLVLGTGTTFVTSPGSYTYFAAASNTCSQGPRTAISVSIVPPPAIAISGNTTICNGYTVNLSASGINTFTWSTGANTSTINAVVNSQFTVSGFDAVTGCSNTAVSNLTIQPSPVVAINGPSAVCSGSTINLSANGADMYFWNTGVFTPTIAPTITTNTLYTVVGTYTLNGCTTKVQKPIIANPLPSMTVTGNSTVCPGQTLTLIASGAAGYFWNNGASTASTTVAPGGTTTYSVVGVSNAGCTYTLPVTVVVPNCVGIKSQTNALITIAIFPNPTNGEFTVELNNGLNKTFEMYDLTGRIVLKASSEKDKTILNINALANGIYYLKVQSNNAFEVFKIVKQ